MHLSFDVIADFVGTIAALALIAVPYGASLRRIARAEVRETLLGALFGAASATAMFDPLVLANGVFLDMRCLPVALAGAFLGPLGAIPAILISGAVRIFLGGAGMAPGLLAIAIAGGVGVLWFRISPRLSLRGLSALALLGAAVSIHLLAALALPPEIRAHAFGALIPAIAALNFAGTLVVGGLMDRERRSVDRHRALDIEAVTDPLTGIANRRGFERRVGALGGRHAGFALLEIDVDHFKSINDTHGHDAGDQVLREVSARLDACLRAGDVIARFGGEEFVVLLPGARIDATRAIAERLRQSVADAPFVVSGRAIDVTISVGARHEAGALSGWSEALRRTDRALYAAKAQGRNRVVFDEAMPAAA